MPSVTVDCVWCAHAEKCIHIVSSCPALPNGESDDRISFKSSCPKNNLPPTAAIIIGSVLGGVFLIGAIIGGVLLYRCKRDGQCSAFGDCCGSDSCCNCCCDCNHCCTNCCEACCSDSCSRCCGNFWSCTCLCVCIKALCSNDGSSAVRRRREQQRHMQHGAEDRERIVGFGSGGVSMVISSPTPQKQSQPPHSITTVTPAAEAPDTAAATASPTAGEDAPKNPLSEHLAFQPASSTADGRESQSLEPQYAAAAPSSVAGEGVEMGLPVLQRDGQSSNFLSSGFV